MLRRLRHLVLVAYLLFQPSRGAYGGPLVGEGKENGRPPRVDLYGDPLPPGVLARLGTMRLRHGGGGNVALDFSPDGKTLASGGHDYLVRLWEVATGKELRRLAGHQNIVHAVAFSHNGERVASGSGGGSATADSSLRIWDARTGKQLRRWTHPFSRVSAIVFSPDDQTIIYSLDGGLISVRSVTTGKLVRKFRNPDQTLITALAISPDGRTLAALSAFSDGAVCLWDVTSGKQLPPLPDHKDKGGITAVAFSPDGKVLAGVGHSGLCRAWDLHEPKESWRVDLEGQGWRQTAFAVDRKTLLCASGQMLVRCRATDGHVLTRVKCKGGEPLWTAALSRDGTLLAGSAVGDILFWETQTGRLLHRRPGHSANVRMAVFLPDNRTVATAGDDRTLRFWDMDTATELRHFPGHKAVAFAPDGKTFASRSSERADAIRLFDAETGRELRKLVPLDPTRWLPCTDFVFSPDGKYLAVGGHNGGKDHVSPLRLWEVATGAQVREFPVCSELSTLVFSPDGQQLATARYGGSGTVQTWDVATGKEVCTYPDRFNTTASALTFSPDGKLLSIGFACREAGTGKELPWFWRGPAPLSVAFSPDGRTVAVGALNIGPVYLWETATGEERGRFEGHSGRVWSVAFSHDGRRLVSASDDGAPLVWDVTGTILSPPAKRPRLTPDEMAALWVDLGGQDAPKAWRAVRALIGRPDQTVPFLKGRRLERPGIDPTEFAALIARLDNDSREVRERASRELEALGRAAEPGLRKVLAGRPSAEVRRRVQAVLETLKLARMDAGPLRATRALEVLEYIGSPEARAVLETVAGARPETRLTREAKASLARLGKRAAAKP